MVAHRKLDATLAKARFHPYGLSRAGEMDRVAEQVGGHPSNQGRVDVDPRQRRVKVGAYLDAAQASPRRLLPDDVLDDLIQRARCLPDLECPAVDAVRVEKIRGQA